jgi:HD superfamily phosphodiesterase
MSISTDIESAGIKYKRILEDYFIETWGSTGLISHGIDHHRRVWHYAGELLNELAVGQTGYSLVSPDKLIIGCYLHDLGMSADRGKKHGRLSSMLCRQFLERYGLPLGDFSDVLKAIEDHDDKEYRDPGEVIDLARILTIADDLDAFGYIGIYRYLEIYIERGVKAELITKKIRENALSRFLNFETTFSTYPRLVLKHRKRFMCLDYFLSDWGRQISGQDYETLPLAGYKLLLRILSEHITSETTPITYPELKKEYNNDTLLKSFFMNLYSELGKLDFQY